MSKQEWRKEIPRLRAPLDGKIESILKFSYDALCDEDKDLFLHVAYFFNQESIETLEDFLGKSFLDLAQSIHVLAEKSLISINSNYVEMHDFLAKLGREIVRKQSVQEPGQRQFLVDARDIFEVLADDTAGGRSVLGIDLDLCQNEDILNISEKAFEGMSNLQFLRFKDFGNRERFNPEFLVELNMYYSKLEKLWEPLRNLKRINLCYSKNLKELPDLSSATNFEVLNLNGCSSLVELPFSIGNATKLLKLDLNGCSSLLKLPSYIGNAINLQMIGLSFCSNLVELPSSIGNATNLKELDLTCCSSLMEFPSSIGNCTNLKELDLSLVELPSFIGKATNLMIIDLGYLPCLVELPSFIGNLHKLSGLRLRGCEKLQDLPTNINLEFLDELDLTDCSMLKTFPVISTNFKRLHLRGTEIEEVPSSLRSWPRLADLQMFYNKNLNCKEARDLIIQATARHYSILPSGKVPTYITNRATGSSLTMTLNQRDLPTSLRFKACIVLADNGDHEAGNEGCMEVCLTTMERQNDFISSTCISKNLSFRHFLTEHLYAFEVLVEVEATSEELVFDFKLNSEKWEIGECGVLELKKHVQTFSEIDFWDFG
ncbi:Leucine-rich repeat 3 [Arabidopsis thaliana x Arabidopsis arenosa]|uniref:Leucine-rich repeat 3 n=1 Tax=Arabidopsis thaliana x Arabidopsis arenosa TaxID=1240361 RepID=A0A8T2AXP8_9BRAS|nr:Leucine-rich repeat 3 [Arabidopsis thaliana x Arabidopsis arenosa]